jgi:hypothetical protein
MNSKTPYIWFVILCAVCALLEYMPFAGALYSARYVEFGLLPVAAAVVYMDAGAALAAALLCGFLLDSGSGAVLHIPVFAAYVVAGRFVSRFFYSPRSVFHIAVQMALLGVVHLALYAAVLHRFSISAFEWQLWARAAGLNVASACVILALWPVRRRRFSVYRI